MYGFGVESEVALPLRSEAHRVAAPDWMIRRSQTPSAIHRPASATYTSEIRCYAPCHQGNSVGSLARVADGAWIQYEGYGTFQVSPALNEVQVFPDSGCDQDRLGLMLSGPISVAMLHLLGVPCLHASAVSTRRGAVAFVGANGSGKSSLAAYFLHRGASLLSDDVLPVRETEHGFSVGPGLPLMKLWPEAAKSALQVSGDLPNVATNQHKKFVSLEDRFAFAQTAVPLRAVYLIGRYQAVASETPAIEIRSLAGGESLMSLCAHTSHKEFLMAAEQQRLLRFYARLGSAVAVRSIRYPSGFQHQARVHMQVLQDLDAM
jgi:hypothetical protein